MENEQWNVKMPLVTKYPKAKHITINKLYKQFVKR